MIEGIPIWFAVVVFVAGHVLFGALAVLTMEDCLPPRQPRRKK